MLFHASKMTNSLIDTIDPILERLGADDIRIISEDDADKVKASIYGREYTFTAGNNDSIIAMRDDGKATYFSIKEIERLEHINMPFLQLVGSNVGHYSLPEQRSTDIALRLHLIMEGDVYTSEEVVTYLGAGTQRSSNYYHSKG